MAKVKKEPKKRGPKPKEINWGTFEELCNIQCTQPEIAGCLQISLDALVYKVEEKYNLKFSEVYKKFSEGGKASLRRSLYQKAINGDKGSIAAAIWLSKQHLNMKDKVEDDRLADLVPMVIETSQGTYALGLGKKQQNENDIRTDYRDISEENK